MSSFHKVVDTHVTISGTKLKNNLPVISSGIPSLDHLIGGGLPIGTIFTVEEDVLGVYSRILGKYFLAEGIVCKHAIFVASLEENVEEIIKEIPQPCVSPPDDEITNSSKKLEKMKIAWRYEELGQVESSFGTNTNFGHHFDLSKHIDADTIKTSDILYWNPTKDNVTVMGFKNVYYYKLLNKIKEIISKEEYKSNTKGKQNVIRLFIQSLGSPIWMMEDCDENLHETTYGQDLLKFLYCLRTLLRDKNAVAFITIPTHSFDDDSLVKRLLYSIDNAVKIESFAGSSKETNPVYKDYHGLFHMIKLSATFSLVPFVPPSLDLAFKLRRKKFVIEILHLPPELQESSEREQDDITASPTIACGGFRKKDIDF